MAQAKEIDVYDIKGTIEVLFCLNIKDRNTKGYDISNLTPNTPLLEIFPSEPVEKGGRYHYVDEQANRLGLAIFDTILLLRQKYDLPALTHNYEPREEFLIFDVVEDVVLHLLNEVMQHLGGNRGEER